jgi:hypothetical protein
MELGGTEKRIQVLFSELSLEDRTHVPQFEQLWTMRVATTSPAPLFRRSWAVAVVVIAAVSLFSLWSRQSQTVLGIAPLAIPTPASPEVVLVVEPARQQQPRKKRIIRQRQPDSVLSEAALLSRWQSPTQNFMQSPGSVSFNSLPQLNQSAKDLESFLPKNDGRIKESNQ